MRKDPSLNMKCILHQLGRSFAVKSSRYLYLCLIVSKILIIKVVEVNQPLRKKKT